MVAVWLLACDPTEPPLDAGPDAGPPELVVTAPEPPAPPDDPCAAGWGSIDPEEPVGCTAYPSGVEDCAPHEVHLPGAEGCVAVGSACGDRLFPEPPSAGRAWYVAPGGAGAGTRESPFGSVAEAVRAAADGDTVLLGRGRFVLPAEVVVSGSLTLRGVCATQTELRAESPSTAHALLSVAGTLTLGDVTLSGPRPGVWVHAGSELNASGVAFVDLAETGVVVLGRATVEDSAFHMREGAVAGALNMGAAAIDGGELTVADSELRGHHDMGLRARGEGSRLHVERTRLGARYEDDDRAGGRGVEVIEGAAADFRHVAFEGGDPVGLFVAGATTRATLADSELFDSGTIEVGAAAVVRAGARLDIRRTSVVGGLMAGLAAFDEGTRLGVEDSVLVDVGLPERHTGMAMQIEHAHATLHRVAIYAPGAVGIAALEAQLEATDVLIQNTGALEQWDPERAAAAVNLDRTTASLQRVQLVGSSCHGLAATDSTLTLRDLSVSATLHHDSLGYGFGVFLLNSAATLERAHFVDNAYVALGTMERGSVVRATDVLVERTLASVCLDPSCRTFAGGIGVVAYDGAHLSLERFILRGSELAAAQVAHGYTEDEVLSEYPGQLDLRQGRIEDNFVGVSVQVEDYDYERLTGSVEFLRNEHHLDASQLPVARPGPSEP